MTKTKDYLADIIAEHDELTTQYRIFDSMDRPEGRPAGSESELYEHLRTLENEAAETGSTVTYAIGKILPNGNVTFDF